MIQFDEHIFQMGWFNHQPVAVLPRVSHGKKNPLGFFGINMSCVGLRGHCAGCYGAQVDCAVSILGWMAGLGPLERSFQQPRYISPIYWGGPMEVISSRSLVSWFIIYNLLMGFNNLLI